MNLDPLVDLRMWVIVWLATALFLLLRHWRSGSGSGLLLAYVVNFGAIHWLAAALLLLPWNRETGVDIVTIGMREASLATLAFAAGVELSLALFRRRERRAEPDSESRPVDPVSTNIYLFAGVILQVVVAPIAVGLATLSALVGTGTRVVILGMGLKCWDALRMGNRAQVWLWLSATLMLPFFTVVTMGFLGYGLAAMLAIFAIAAALYGPRPQLIAVGLIMGFLAASVYVTYMRDRGEIRALVWGGGGLSDRIDQVLDTVTDGEWFDPYNDDHLHRMDSRLNQNRLVGAAIVYLENGYVDYAHGTTLVDALVALVPRALWPEKPVAAGSGDLVSTYTGIEFDQNTSVGLGQLMEWYVNFGTAGVLVGFFLTGALLIFIDRAAASALHRGDSARFGLWYVPGLSLLLLEGSFVEITSSAGAALATMVALNYISARWQRRPVTAEPTSEIAIASAPESWL